MAKIPKIAIFVIFLQHLNKEERNLVDFLHAKKQTLLYKLLILLILVGMARHGQFTQNNKFAKIVWYSKNLIMVKN